MGMIKVNKWILSISCALSLFVSYGVTLNFSLLVEDIRESLNLSYGEVSVVIAISFGLIQLLGPLASVTIDWIGEKQSVIIFGLLSSLCLAGVAFIESYALLVLTLGVTYGISQSVTVVACITAPGRVFDESHRHAGLSIPPFGIALSFTVMPLLFHCLNDLYTWRGTLLILSALTLHVCATGFLLNGEKRVVSSIKERVCLNNLSDKRLILFMTASFIYQYADTGTSVLFHSLITQQYHLSRDNAWIVMTVYGLSQLIGRFFASFLRPCRLCPSWVQWCLATTGSFLATILLGVCSTFNASLLLMALYGFMLGLVIPLRVVTICELFSAEQLTKVYGYACFAMGLGSLTGPATVGSLIDASGGYTLPFVLMGTLGLLAFSLAVACHGVIMFAQHYYGKAPLLDIDPIDNGAVDR